MTVLRQRMTEDMQVRNLSPHTQASYLQQVSLFARHFRTSPDALTPDLSQTLGVGRSALYLVEGIVLVVLGMIAIIVRPLPEPLIGWILLISGVVGLVTAFWAPHAPGGFRWSLVTALLCTAAGPVLLVLQAWDNWRAVYVLPVLIVFFTIEGVASIMFGLAHRKHSMVASGVFDLVLASLAVWAVLADQVGFYIPASLFDRAVVGQLVGISRIFRGTALVIVQALPGKPSATATSPG
jgi:uncharacterized membrane protein HdeD (DUF308 family)